MSTHECTLGHVMSGQVIDGVFYCAHGVALGTPEPQPDPPVMIKVTFPQEPTGTPGDTPT